MVDTIYITTFVGVLGATLGGATSFSTTWFAQRTQAREMRRIAARQEREALFRDFIGEASRLYGDALSHEKDDVASLVQLYALVGRMRLVASREVIVAAEEAMETIIEAYLAPNRTLHELRDFARAGRVDLLQDFASASRAELLDVLTGRPMKDCQDGSRPSKTAKSPDARPNFVHGEEEIAAVKRIADRCQH